MWSRFIHPAAARNLFVVAHSYGGIVTMSLANEFKEVATGTFLPLTLFSRDFLRVQL